MADSPSNIGCLLVYHQVLRNFSLLSRSPSINQCSWVFNPSSVPYEPQNLSAAARKDHAARYFRKSWLAQNAWVFVFGNDEFSQIRTCWSCKPKIAVDVLTTSLSPNATEKSSSSNTQRLPTRKTLVPGTFCIVLSFWEGLTWICHLREPSCKHEAMLSMLSSKQKLARLFLPRDP